MHYTLIASFNCNAFTVGNSVIAKH